MSKFIFVTGGVCSSLGKGLAASSIGTILECHNYKICHIKIDPYINIDAGTMSPFQHGEVYVTDDGFETDLDLGNYARFSSVQISKEHSITTGQIYESVISQERKGNYLGKCVQVVPHITNEIKSRIQSAAVNANSDLTIVEVGGTVGDIESIPFLEAIRQLIHQLGSENILSIHLTLIPEVGGGEFKTKPTQHAVREMREIGIQPDILLCRSSSKLSMEAIHKIAMFTSIDKESVISAHDETRHLYRIPLNYRDQGLDILIQKKLGLRETKGDFTVWEELDKKIASSKSRVRIAMVGKYIDVPDTYKSVDEALLHGAFANSCNLEIVRIDSSNLEAASSKASAVFKNIHGILIPGGFGVRGVEGMIKTAQFAREQKVPFLGICLGMQIMLIEYMRNAMNIRGANSTEFEEQPQEPVISLLEEQVDIINYGGTMRKGKSKIKLLAGSKLFSTYGQLVIEERHRHRYEFNNKYRAQIDADQGIAISGTTMDEVLVEGFELLEHPWGFGVQFHPEFTSRPINANPIFRSFLQHTLDYSKTG